MLHTNWLGYTAAALTVATSIGVFLQLSSFTRLFDPSKSGPDRAAVSRATRMLLLSAGAWQASVGLVLAAGGEWVSAIALLVVGPALAASAQLHHTPAPASVPSPLADVSLGDGIAHLSAAPTGGRQTATTTVAAPELVQAQALRAAAEAYPFTRDMVSRGSVRRWLRERADSLAEAPTDVTS